MKAFLYVVGMASMWGLTYAFLRISKKRVPACAACGEEARLFFYEKDRLCENCIQSEIDAAMPDDSGVWF